MTARTELSPNMVLVVSLLAARGSMDARQVSDATGLAYDTARQYLRRLTFRGVVASDRRKFHPIYTAAPGWKGCLSPAAAEPDHPTKRDRSCAGTTVARAIKAAPALHSVWN